MCRVYRILGWGLGYHTDSDKFSKVGHESSVGVKAEVLWQAFKRSTCAVQRRRIQLIALLTEGKCRVEVRAVTRYSDPAYCKAIERYNAQGLAGLRDLRHTNPGAPQLLSDAQMLLLAQAIRFDFDQGVLWDGAKVQAWLLETFDLEVHAGRVYEFIAQVGFSRVCPRPRHVDADTQVQDAFKNILSAAVQVAQSQPCSTGGPAPLY